MAPVRSRNFSVIILTLNEERDLPRCLESVRECHDVVVLDSGSIDATVRLAQDAGARVFTRPFDDFAGQRNFAQREIPFRHPWVFHLDADEQMTPGLAAECDAASASDGFDGYFVAPKMMFQGRWLPHCTDFPAYQARFVRAPEFHFVQVGHGQREAPGMRMGKLQENYFHDLSSGGEEEWLAKHQRYARQEAQAHGTGSASSHWGDLVSSSALARRRALKRLSYRLPFRPTLRFAYQYLLRGGLLDGRPGLRYCRLLAKYEEFSVTELRRLRKGAQQ